MDELQRLIALRDIERVLADYTRALDARRMDACALAYSDEPLVVVNGVEHRGAAAVDAWLTMLGTRPGGRHVTTGVTIELADDGRAQAITDLTVVHGGPGEWRVAFVGAYEDVLVHEQGRWKLAERRITLR